MRTLAVGETAVPQEAPAPLVRRIFSRRMGICVAQGFVSGLPLYLLLTLVTAWLRKEGVDLKLIGLMALLMVPYTWKFVWAPLLDRFSLLGLGRRRGWMLLSQLVLIAAICLMGLCRPAQSMGTVALLCFVVALASATQDIALDAYRREILVDEELGLGNSLFVNAYRIAGLIPGGLSLILADFISWSEVFVVTAAFMLPGVMVTLLIREVENNAAPRTLYAAVVEPWREFMQRAGFKHALLIVLFVFLYKVGDSMATALATPFYVDLGYELSTIGIIAKNVGLWSMVAGGLLGGIWMLKLGINRSLWIFGVGQLITILGLAVLAKAGESGVPSLWLFSLAVGGEALGAGLGTAAFVAFIASQTNKAYTATQFALLTSLSAVPRTFCNALTGYIVHYLGWTQFFLLCMLLAVPGMLLLFKVAPWSGAVIQVGDGHNRVKNTQS
ncbi:MAG: AmpG family muropeptide MFS transporter [Succinivibrio sp.]|nr:AmpG family muropeptide MFS transporter [Succinivibrio sp.]